MENKSRFVYSPEKKFIVLLNIILPAAVIVPLIALIFNPEAGLGLFAIFCLLILMIYWILFSGHPKKLYLEKDALVIDKFLKKIRKKIAYAEIESAEVLPSSEIIFLNWRRNAPVLSLRLKHVNPDRAQMEGGDLYSRFLSKRMDFDFGNTKEYDEFLAGLKEKILAHKDAPPEPPILP
ncbi:MAG: hypothetical protein KKF93_07245 [Candidatus Omnitrophica bacterium]|nr:hypothetical protein [Candidatus Omnitrophota bacterium]